MVGSGRLSNAAAETAENGLIKASLDFRGSSNGRVIIGRGLAVTGSILIARRAAMRATEKRIVIGSMRGLQGFDASVALGTHGGPVMSITNGALPATLQTRI